MPFESKPESDTQSENHLQVLLECAQRGGGGTQLGELLQSYQNYLTLLARAQIGRRLQARISPSDVVQETVMDAVRDFAQFHGSSEREFLSWLRQILINNLMRCVEQHVKAAKRDVRCEISLQQLARKVDQTATHIDRFVLTANQSPSAVASRRELAVVIADQLAKLPDHYRDVIVLRNLEGLSFEDVATEMDRTVGAVRMLWLRAIDRFRTLIEATGIAADIDIPPYDAK